MERVYRTYDDTEVASLYVSIACPHCGHEWQELDMDECGTTYQLECEECETPFEMYFDAS